MPKTKRRNKKQHGGEFLGEGAFGAVYGNPRLQCKDETDKDDLNNTVSKIFKKDDEKYAQSEFNVLTILDQHMDSNNLKKLRDKYALLPIKKCIIDEKSLANEPYNTDAWKMRTQNDKIVRSEHFFKDANSTVETGASLVIYDKGGDNLSTVFKTLQNATNINELYQVLIKLTNILEAIQILQGNNFIHGDIKPANCIVDKDGNYRLIDIADVNYIASHAYKGENMPTAFMYFAWPSTVLYSFLFKYDSFEGNELTDAQFKHMFKLSLEFNMKQFNYIKEYFLAFDRFPYVEIYEKKISHYKNILVQQKTFGINDTVLMDFYKNQKDKKNQKDEKLKMQFGELDIENIKTHLSEFNKFFAESSFKSRLDLKLDLFKRCDIYSFGIIVLACIENATKILKSSMIEKTQTLLTNLFKFVWMCCYQDKKVKDINELVAFWKENIVFPITPKPFTPKLEKENDKSYLGKSDLDLSDSSPKGCFGKACEVASSVFGFTQRRGGSKYKRNRFRKVRQTHKNRRR